MNFWLLKSEPAVYSIDDLARDGQTSWEGVRNYQARNFIRDQMKHGDGVLFYHSNAQPPGVAGLAQIIAEATPDPTAWDPEHKYYDPQGSPENPRWYWVQVGFVAKFPRLVSLELLKKTPGLETLWVIRKGMRLSVLPVDPAHYQIIQELGQGGR